jgi:hypothetical protein
MIFKSINLKFVKKKKNIVNISIKIGSKYYNIYIILSNKPN